MERDNPQPYRVYSADGISPCLNTCEGGGREVHIVEPFGIDYNVGGMERPVANTIKAKYDKGVGNFKQDGTAVCVPVLTPDRAEKRQNGRRFKDNGEEAFTLTAQDRHGVAIGVDIKGNEVQGITDIAHCLNANDQRKIFGASQERTLAGVAITEESLYEPLGVFRTVTKETFPSDDDRWKVVEIHPGVYTWAVWYEKYHCYVAIRKLTPRECFRLQGWDDEYFERAALVNSDSRLYKLAGNGITVNVMQSIGELF